MATVLTYFASLQRYSVVPMVTFFMIVGLAVGLIGCWAIAGAAIEPFGSSATTPKAPPPPTYTLGAPLYVQWGNSFCIYPATLSRLPIDPGTAKPYATIEATSFDPMSDTIEVRYHSHLGSVPPNGKTNYREDIPALEAYGFPGNETRARRLCRVYLAQDPANVAYVRNRIVESGVDPTQRQLYCNPIGYSTDYGKAQNQTIQQLHTHTATSVVTAHSDTKQTHRNSHKQSTPADRNGMQPTPAPAPAPDTTTPAKKSGSCNACAWTFTAVPFQPGTRPKSVVETIAISQRDEGGAGVRTTQPYTHGQDPYSKRGGTRDNIPPPDYAEEWTRRAANANASANASAAQVTAQTGAGSIEGGIVKQMPPFSQAEPQTTRDTVSHEPFATGGSAPTKPDVESTNTVAAKENSKVLYVINLIMVDLWKNTVIDTTRMPDQPLNASPSITSDTYHTARTNTAELNDYMFYNTPNGCVPPDLSDVSPQSTMLRTHPTACSGTMYRFKTPKRTELHMVGSDEGGSALLMFPQLLHTLNDDMQSVMGTRLPAVQEFATAISLCLFEYMPMRKFATVYQLRTQLAEFYTVASTSTSTSTSTQIALAVQKRLGNLNKMYQVTHPGQLPFVDNKSTLLYTQPYNRMLPMLVTRANDSVSHDTTVTSGTEGTPSTMCCEHDRVISVGLGNTDVAADMTIAAYQNTSFTRLMIGGKMSSTEEEMLGDIFRDTARLDMDARDRCVLRLFVYVYLGVMTNHVMGALQSPAGTPSHLNHHPKPAGVSSTARSSTAFQLIRQTGVQLLALTASLPPATIATHPLMVQWASRITPGNDPERSVIARQIVDVLLPVSPTTPQNTPRTITDHTPVPKIAANKTILVPAYTDGPVYTTTVNLPWVSGVFGVHSAVEHAQALRFNVYTEVVQHEPSRRACRVVVQRVGPHAGKGWDTPFRVVLTKRITIERVTPSTFMNRIFLGYHTPYNIGNVHSALPHSPVYALSDSAINPLTSAFANGKVYRSALELDADGNGLCYRIQCPPTVDRCCTGVADVSLCGSQLLADGGQPLASCPRGASVGQLTASDAACHATSYNTTQCQDPFHQLLANARNATLVLDEAAVPSFVEFLANTETNGVRLSMLAKLVKTLILTTTLFHDLAVAAQTLSAAQRSNQETTDSPAFRSGIQLWTTLDHLFTIYEVVGLVAPPVMSDGGELLSNPTNLRTTIEMDVNVPCHTCPTPQCADPTKYALGTRSLHTIAYQASKTLTLTFRRRLDNSKPWRAQPGTTLYQLQAYSNNARDLAQSAQTTSALATLTTSHHATATFNYTPDVMHTVLSYSCPPAMTQTIREMQWFGRPYVGVDVVEQNPITFGILDKCPM